MDVGGNTREGWIAVIPLTVFILIMTYVVGGPVAFANLAYEWGADIVSSVSHFVRHL